MAEANPGQKLQELRSRYIAGLPDRVGELRDSWNRLLHVSWNSKALEFMYQSAHKLTGSGATFQFPEISNTARILEEQLQALLAKSDATSTERQHIENSLKALERATEEASRAAPNTEMTAFASKADVGSRQTYRIAVIEDDGNQAAYLKNWLEQQGYCAETFEDPDTYTRRTDGQFHHLILLDISFPQGALEGIGWLERMKYQAGSNTPVIIMSARSDMVARMRALRAGADIYLTKPVDMGVLKKRIHQLLENTPLTRPRVLWVDDDTDLLGYYETMLSEEGYEVEGLSQPVRVLERIEQFQPDAIVLDHDMPGCQGIELAKVLRQDANYMAIPILFVSASTEARELLEQHSIAGNDFFRKPLNNERFLNSLHRHLINAKLIAARINLVSQRKESRSLHNHDYFLTELVDLLAGIESGREDQAHYLVQANIDRQEYLLAQHGARAMANLSARMEKHFAQQLAVGDSGCALGNGSFLFRVAAPAADDGRVFLERFHHTLNNPAWAIENTADAVTLSLGALTLNHALDEDKALIEVKKACSKALQSGSNKLIWQQAPERPLESRLDDRIKELIAAQAFKLHYQPIVNMETGDTLFEALVRLVDENNAVYLPGQFLPWLPGGNRDPFYALDRWVIQHAVEDLTHLEGKASASYSVCVKLSSPMVDVEHLLTVLSSAIRENRIKGNRRIYLALSSPTVLKDVPRAKKIAKLVQAMGCGLVIEHVATDTASVDLIKELDSVDLVKLAPTLGASAQQTPALKDLLGQLKAALSSSRKIVVTGVEDAKALSWFWEQGIRNFQGYFIQEPKGAMSYEL
ncbi:MAG: DNA-binding response OmpR family regulator [Marinobacter maritimus]|jgi:DNA-binding response OmpR family regulator/EAL domain-containing protein (putative c-di-GMP-specific phosphodiesterase class I)/HPt (histidine-containing phosphotransfer) domain-containing protein|nr:response regulator [Oceanospirillales bacterium]